METKQLATGGGKHESEPGTLTRRVSWIDETQKNNNKARITMASDALIANDDAVNEDKEKEEEGAFFIERDDVDYVYLVQGESLNIILDGDDEAKTTSLVVDSLIEETVGGTRDS
jgi:hypothetical protein